MRPKLLFNARLDPFSKRIAAVPLNAHSLLVTAPSLSPSPLPLLSFPSVVTLSSHQLAEADAARPCLPPTLRRQTSPCRAISAPSTRPSSESWAAQPPSSSPVSGRRALGNRGWPRQAVGSVLRLYFFRHRCKVATFSAATVTLSNQLISSVPTPSYGTSKSGVR